MSRSIRPPPLALVLAATAGFVIGSVCTLHLSGIVSSGLIAFSPSAALVPTNISKVDRDFDAIWPDLKSRLCPDMKPNAALGAKLFRLARDELKMIPYGGEGRRSADGRDVDNGALAASAWDAYTFHPQPWSYAPNEQPLPKGLYGGSVSLGEKTKGLDESNNTASGDSSSRGIIVCLRIYKAANDQIRTWARLEFADRNSQRKMGRFRDSDAIDRLQRISAWKGACVVTAIRDPIERFLSGYNEIEVRWSGRAGNQDQDDSHKPKFRYARDSNGTKARFQQFVAEYVSSDTGREGWDWKYLDLGHIWSMSGVLYGLAKGGGKMTDYLPSLSNLTYKWPEFVRSTCPDLPKEIAKEPMRVTGQHGSSEDRRGYYAAAKSVWADGRETAHALCALNIMDYACWGKLPGGVPSLCKAVYSRPGFVSAIINDDHVDESLMSHQ